MKKEKPKCEYCSGKPRKIRLPNNGPIIDCPVCNQKSPSELGPEEG